MKKFLLPVILIAALNIYGCEKDISTPRQKDGNLIINSSFENDRGSSFEGWTGSNYSLMNDVKAGDGNWSLQLQPEWFPGEGYAETFITGFNGDYKLFFSCDTKTINWTGQLILRLKTKDGELTDLQKITFNNTEWNSVTVTTTVILSNTDELIVHLSAGATEVANGDVLFDNVTLKLL